MKSPSENSFRLGPESGLASGNAILDPVSGLAVPKGDIVILDLDGV